MSVKALKKAIKQAKGVAEGTVIRYVREFDSRKVAGEKDQFTFLGLYVGGFWYTTAEAREMERRLTNSMMVELLAGSDVVSVAVATEWQVVSDE